jgi:hypothetical protein
MTGTKKEYEWRGRNDRGNPGGYFVDLKSKIVNLKSNLIYEHLINDLRFPYNFEISRPYGTATIGDWNFLPIFLSLTGLGNIQQHLKLRFSQIPKQTLKFQSFILPLQSDF